MVDIAEILHENLLKEAFNKIIPTNYKVVNYSDYIAFEFKTDSGTQYDLEFHLEQEDTNIILNNGKSIKEILNTNVNRIPCIELAFTQSNVVDKDDADQFEAETNKNEPFELMGRITYIIKDSLKKYNKYKLFIVGASRRNKSKMYEYMFDNHFKNEFDKYTGVTPAYKGGESLFFIKK